jgi:uncharacterized protein with HEPN domain
VRTDRLRLLDAIEQIALIRSFSAAGREAFFGDLLIQSAVLHRLALLGEACRGLSPQLRDAHSAVPWEQIIAFRNVVIHQYFGIDLELVWSMITDHAAPLKCSLESIVNSLPE